MTRHHLIKFNVVVESQEIVSVLHTNTLFEIKQTSDIISLLSSTPPFHQTARPNACSDITSEVLFCRVM